jgi:hypothetical protein
LDQPGQRYAHRVVEIGVAEAPVQLQAREDAIEEDAALSTGTRSAAAQTDRSCESVKASMAVMVLAVPAMSNGFQFPERAGVPMHPLCRLRGSPVRFNSPGSAGKIGHAAKRIHSLH